MKPCDLCEPIHRIIKKSTRQIRARKQAPSLFYNQLLEDNSPYSHCGVASKGLQIFVPISPRVTLIFYDKDVYQVGSSNDREILVLRTDDADQLNGLQYADRPDSMLRELFALMLARELGLTAPEPVLVELQDGFDWAATDLPEYADLIRWSIGWNVGTIHLGEGWKPWVQGSAPRSIPDTTLDSRIRIWTCSGLRLILQNFPLLRTIFSVT